VVNREPVLLLKGPVNRSTSFSHVSSHTHSFDDMTLTDEKVSFGSHRFFYFFISLFIYLIYLFIIIIIKFIFSFSFIFFTAFEFCLVL
jgi:hypothetical protein